MHPLLKNLPVRIAIFIIGTIVGYVLGVTQAARPETPSVTPSAVQDATNTR